MRHGDKINNLGRKKAHRQALLSNLTCQLIRYKRIVTTLAKAKALRVYAEPLITKAKENTTHQRRVVFSYLQDKEAITELFSTVSEKVAGRPGGYTEGSVLWFVLFSRNITAALADGDLDVEFGRTVEGADQQFGIHDLERLGTIGHHAGSELSAVLYRERDFLVLNIMIYDLL